MTNLDSYSFPPLEFYRKGIYCGFSVCEQVFNQYFRIFWQSIFSFFSTISLAQLYQQMYYNFLPSPLDSIIFLDLRQKIAICS